MTNPVKSIPLQKLVPHPDNPNRQSQANFAKLVRNIKRTGRYEPLIVRPCPPEYLRSYESGKVNEKEWIWSGICNDERQRSGEFFQVINGHHRCRALAELGYKEADVIVWDVDDEQADILLATLNRLAGSEELAKKLKLLGRLNKRMQAGELAKLIPQTANQIQRLTNLKRPNIPAKTEADSFAGPMVFFLADAQKQIVENALSLADKNDKKTKAVNRASALVCIAQHFLSNSTKISESLHNDQKKDVE
jgi:ParB-like chromosome segregation protein Spo0J